jgi:hypothetical protein
MALPISFCAEDFLLLGGSEGQRVFLGGRPDDRPYPTTHFDFQRGLAVGITAVHRQLSQIEMHGTVFPLPLGGDEGFKNETISR